MASAGAWALDAGSLTRILAQGTCVDTEPFGELLGTVPLTGDRPRQTPFGEAVGGPGLDTRLFTDLSVLDPGRLITPTAHVFVRTAPPPGVESMAATWTVALGAPASGRSIGIDELRRLAKPLGAHLIECAGNNDPDNFGLLSVADWSGVPLVDLVGRLQPTSADWGVLATGVDHEADGARSSRAGASWILPLADLRRLGAFVAVTMNGEPLTVAHGAPVRLVVPGWYGCAWIKWLREIRLVNADEPATSQMLEFAGRTHQDGRPARARDYEPPVIDLAATPVRVERRRVNGALEYRIVGIAWGGAAPVSSLQIRFNARDEWKPLDVCPRPTTAQLWSLWTYRWKPTEPGTYNIALRCPDASVRTRRLDLFFYTRRVRIDAV